MKSINQSRSSHLTSPLRYPGGKSRAVKQILPIIPTFDEYREPFVGGGSVYFGIHQLYPDKKYWINDLNTDLYLFWETCKNNMSLLVSKVNEIKETCMDGRALFTELTNGKKEFTDFERAVRFFVLNRITFSGTIDSGGYSEQSFNGRFTDSSIKRLEDIKELLLNVEITNLDYQKIIHADGENVFIFLDPPYLSTTKSKLYGKKIYGMVSLIFNYSVNSEFIYSGCLKMK